MDKNRPSAEQGKVNSQTPGTNEKNPQLPQPFMENTHTHTHTYTHKQVIYKESETG